MERGPGKDTDGKGSKPVRCPTCNSKQWLLTLGMMAALVIFFYVYMTNAASIEEREKIITECNERIDKCNEQISRCQACLYNKTDTDDIWWGGFNGSGS